MILAALRERLPWSALLVQPETVLGWHRALVRRRWAAYRRRPRRGRPPLEEECRELIVRMALENPSWGYLRIRGELLKLGQTVSATAIRSVLKLMATVSATLLLMYVPSASTAARIDVNRPVKALGLREEHSGCFRPHP
jgi:hypothetical protein